jgi:hypothetical protein
MKSREEYDRIHKQANPLPPDIDDGTVELETKTPKKKTTPEERHQKEMQRLHAAGADYNGNESWKLLMRKFGRIR